MKISTTSPTSGILAIPAHAEHSRRAVVIRRQAPIAVGAVGGDETRRDLIRGNEHGAAHRPHAKPAVVNDR